MQPVNANGDPMTFASFIQQGWNDHGDNARAVADRLASSLAAIASSADLAPFAKLAAHVYGEHLGQWGAGAALLESLRGLPVWDAASEGAGAVVNGIAVLRCAAGGAAALEPVAPADRAWVLAAAASALAGRHEFSRALTAYAAALELAERGLPPGSPAIRALAAGGNNLAAALEEKRDRYEVETRGMIMAARAGLRYWKLAGGWLEEERAEYRLARSLLQAGDPGGARNAALRCNELCENHQAPPLELFFSHAVLAHAQRAAGDPAAFAESRKRAMLQYGLVPPDETRWCAAELKELGG
jgi:hypothetical protein